MSGVKRAARGWLSLVPQPTSTAERPSPRRCRSVVSGCRRRLGPRWLMRARRNARDYERLPEHSEAHITWANITLMTRRLARAQEQRQAAEPSSIAA
ncbi:hypothetical protein [Paractinoplanes deccanensis]